MAAAAYSDSVAQGFAALASWSFTTAPTGSTGDIMIAWLTADVNTRTVTSAPSGWTLIAGPIDNSGTADVRAWCYYKIAGASEAGPYVWDFSGTQAGGISMWRGGPVDTADPIDDSAVSGTVAGTSHVSTTITTTGVERRVVCFAGADESATFAPYWSAWTNSAVEREDAELNNFVYNGCADYEKATAGTTSFTVTSADSDGGVVGIVAINPATAGAETTDSATVLVDLEASGTEFREIADAATVLLDLQASGTDVYTPLKVAGPRPIIVGGTVYQDRSRW